jgi:hypothetical protein
MKLKHLQEARYADRELSHEEVEDIVVRHILQISKDLIEDGDLEDGLDNIKSLAEDLTGEAIHQMFSNAVDKIRSYKA